MGTLEKYKLTRIQYLPSIEEEEEDALIVTEKTLPNQFQIRGQNIQMTNAEEMNDEHNQLFKELAQ